jgi:phosphoserine phosphatase
MNVHSSFSPDTDRPLEVALFDVDGTLLGDTPELTGRGLNILIEEGHLPKTGEIAENLAALQAAAESGSVADRRAYYGLANRTFDGFISGKPRSFTDHIAAEVIHEIVAEDALYPEVQAEINELQKSGRYVGLISGSPDFLIQALKRYIGADFATGTRFFMSGGRYHPYRHPESRGRYKDVTSESILVDLSMRRLRALGRGTLNYTGHRPRLADIEEADRFTLHSASGDTVNDLGMLCTAQRPVAVAPKQDLAAIAKASRWDIILPKGSLPQQPQEDVA